MFAFTKERRVRKVFNGVAYQNLGKENFPARKVKVNKRVNNISKRQLSTVYVVTTVIL